MPRLTQKQTDITPFTKDKIQLIKETVAKGSSDLELEMFLHMCNRTGLDPLARQIYAIKRWDSALGRESMAIQTGIDGYRLIAQRTGEHVGTDDAEFDRIDREHPESATVTVYRIVAGMKCGFTATARWGEYVQLKKVGNPVGMWRKMPYGQLAKCAEALALRKGFPAELSGLYTFEENDTQNNGIKIAEPKFSDSGPAPQPNPEPQQEAPQLLNPVADKSLDPTKTVGDKPAAVRKLPKKRGNVYQVLVNRLTEAGYTEEQFMICAKKNKWVVQGLEKLSDAPESDIAGWLDQENFAAIMDELTKMGRGE